jgi:pimeloyl-ACP methyl ester carboxylesterase
MVIVLGVGLALGGLMRGSLVESMLFHPSPGVDLTPAQLGLDAEERYLVTEDDVRIHAFFLRAPGATRGLLFLHGNAGNASHRLPNAGLLAELGAHVLLLDYRGYGQSEGRPSEAGVYADARAGWRELVEVEGLPEQRVVLFGRSLGGAVAVHLAHERRVGGVILESTFSSLEDAGRRMLGPLGAWLARGRFDSASKIARVGAPLLFFHGDRDDVVDLALGRRLFERAPEPKEFELLPGAGHNDTVAVGGAAYYAHIGRFLDSVAP